ncbi:hypothetical protein, partial [Ferrovum myxofaciens]|uniref:hypothetical protein n=1 Tax=Ferrovum myxofaciens TaxID=416213 RepID=UPI0012E8E2AB
MPTSNPFTNGYLILSPAEARIMGVPNPGATTYDGAVGFALPSYTTYRTARKAPSFRAGMNSADA